MNTESVVQHEDLSSSPPSRLYAAGVTQLPPIPRNSKGPNSRGWQHTARSLTAAGATAITGDFGILGDVHPTLDCDTTDPLITAVVADVANEVYARGQPGGRLTHRIGNKGFASLFVREGAEFSKAILRLVNPANVAHGDIELRGLGHQTKYHGTAGPSGAVYVFEDASGRGGIEKLAESAERGLPPISRDGFLSTFRDALQHRLAVDPRARHHRLRVDVAADATLSLHRDRDELLAPSPELLAAAAPFVRNGEGGDRDEWRNVLMAFKGAGGEDAREIAEAYSARWEGGYNSPEYFAQTWASIEPRSLGWDLIRSKAHAGGWNDAFLDFDAIPDAVAPIAAPFVPAYATDGERIAALLQSPAAPFTEEARDAIERPSERGTLLGRYNALVEAAHGSDPLAPLFDAVVHPAALKVGKGHPERLFARMLSARLAGVVAFASLAEAERALLVRAAYLKLVPPVLLDFNAPGDAMTDAEAEATNDLIAGILPWFGVLGIFGESKAGKSFVALGLAMLLGREADGLTMQPPPATWIGAAVGAGHVLYCASEGQAGQWKRYRRAEKKYGASPNFTLLKRVPSLLDLESTVAFFAEATRETPQLAAIVVDVIISALAGGEENSNEDMNTALSNLRLVGMLFGCSTIAVHHAGKGQQDTARGASAWRGSLDAEMKVARPNDTIIGTLTKVKDGRDGDSFSWHLDGDGVLTIGAAPAKAVGETPTAVLSDATHLDRAMLKIAEHNFVTRSEINRAVADECPHRLDPKKADVDRSTVIGRISRAIFDNLNEGWLSKRGEKYKLAPLSPALLARDATTREMQELVGDFTGEVQS